MSADQPTAEFRPSTVASSRRHRRWVAGWLAVTAIVVVGLFAVAWRITGGHIELVVTPSMGQAAPVGSLILTRPVTEQQLAVGDVISFHPPGAAKETITHRIVQISTDGIHTRGDINPAPDPWPLHTPDLVGKAVSIWWGAGWLVKALPLLLLGTLLTWWATARWASRNWRIPLRILAVSLLVSLCSLLLRPFVGMVLMSNTADAAGAHAALVSTGLLPTRFSASTGGHIDLIDGQLAILTTHPPQGSAGFTISSHPHLTWWQWALMILLWLTPMIIGLVAHTAYYRATPPHGTQPREDTSASEDADSSTAADPPAPPPPPPPPDDGRLLTHTTTATPHSRRFTVHRATAARTSTPITAWVAVLVVVVCGAAAGAVSSTSSAFAAKITNSTDTAGVAAAVAATTCRAATAAIGQTNTVFTFPLSDATVTNTSPAADISGNTRNGTYSNNITTTTSRPCLRDTTTTAISLNPTSTATSSIFSSYQTTSSNVFTEVIWFNTTTTTGGRLIGFGNSQNGTSGSYDRHIFMNNTGNIVFGVYVNAVKVIASPAKYNDGTWHQAAATLSSAGMNLYIDGTAVATDTTTTTAEGGTGNTGYWRVGYDNLNGWGTNQPTNFYFTGNLAWASIFNTALTPTQITNLYKSGS